MSAVSCVYPVCRCAPQVSVPVMAHGNLPCVILFWLRYRRKHPPVRTLYRIRIYLSRQKARGSKTSGNTDLVRWYRLGTVFSSAIVKNAECTGCTSSFSARSRRKKMCRRCASESISGSLTHTLRVTGACRATHEHSYSYSYRYR